MLPAPLPDDQYKAFLSWLAQALLSYQYAHMGNLPPATAAVLAASFSLLPCPWHASSPPRLHSWWCCMGNKLTRPRTMLSYPRESSYHCCHCHNNGHRSSQAGLLGLRVNPMQAGCSPRATSWTVLLRAESTLHSKFYPQAGIHVISYHSFHWGKRVKGCMVQKVNILVQYSLVLGTLSHHNSNTSFF